MKVFRTLGVAASLVTLTACLTPEELKTVGRSFQLEDDPSQIPTPPVAPACFNERFVQPQAEISRSIDILFVMDTSGSMDDNRAKVAEGISAFVGELPAEVDYQIGVMLAHGSRSSWSGKLFRYGANTLFKSSAKSIGTIQTELRDMVLHTPVDSGGEQGESGTYSLIKGLTTHLAANQTAGFFRSDAALAIVFVSDENDICAPYIDQPTLPGLTNAERTLRTRDCAAGITANQVLDQVKAVQGTRPYLFGAVIHQSPTYSDARGNDSHGWGYSEITTATSGVTTEINDGNYTTGLANMGRLATIKLNLILDYTLAHTDIDPSTIKAYVDGGEVNFTYDPVANDVHLSSGGGALSTVDLNYCMNPAPAPSPSPSPTGPPRPQA